MPYIHAAPELLRIIIFALIGGLFLNFMPCVLPLLSLKALSFSSKYSKPYLASLCYMTGMAFTFSVFGAIIAFFKSSLSMGFQMQSPYFIMGFIFLFALISLNLFNAIHLPFYNLTTPKTHSQYLDSFMNGVITTLVATPCTGPYVGIAVGYALSQSAFVIVLVFMCLGIGMSLPVLFWTVFSSSIVSNVSSYGKWIESIQKAIGFLCLMTVLWFLYVLEGLIPSESVFLILACLVTLFFGAFFQLPVIMIMSIMTSTYIVYKKDFFEAPQYNVSLETIQKPVILSFTAKWCLNCLKNKRLFYQNERYLKQRGINVIYVDVTKEFPALFYRYKALGVPFNVFIDQEDKETILPEHLTLEDLQTLNTSKK